MANQHPVSPEEIARRVAVFGQSASVSEAARALGISRSALRETLARVDTETPYPSQYWTYEKQLNRTIDTGVVIVGSDAHIWPGERTTAMKALMLVTASLAPQVKMLVANGDWLDGARTNRHPPHGWNQRPTVKEEIECVSDALHDWSVAAKIGRTKAERIYTVGNHELNFERTLATKAKDFEGMPGLRLAAQFPDWSLAWSCMLNRTHPKPVMVKHRHMGGIHAGYNNTLKAGVSTVTGHTHILEVKPWGDYRGRRYGVQSGSLAVVDGPQFEYAENGPSPACSGFVVLTFKNGEMLPPELCEVVDGRALFRGQVVVDDSVALDVAA